MSGLTCLLMIAALHQSEGSEASLASLRAKALTTRVSVLTPQQTEATLEKTPLFRYSDQLRHIEDAGLWLWTRGGRPEAAMKVERYTLGIHPSQWMYCFTSVSPHMLLAEWSGNPSFQSKKSGVTWQKLSDNPVNSRPLRLTQMRDMARRFTAELIGKPDGSDRRQMRLIPRPLFRYPEILTDGGDGAIFGFSGTGTNPDLLLVLDLLPGEGWRYGLAGMTAEGLVVRLEDQKVWEAEHTAGKGSVFDTWTRFFVRTEAKPEN